jgi:hypothetical protein
MFGRIDLGCEAVPPPPLDAQERCPSADSGSTGALRVVQGFGFKKTAEEIA